MEPVDITINGDSLDGIASMQRYPGIVTSGSYLDCKVAVQGQLASPSCACSRSRLDSGLQHDV